MKAGLALAWLGALAVAYGWLQAAPPAIARHADVVDLAAAFLAFNGPAALINGLDPRPWVQRDPIYREGGFGLGAFACLGAFAAVPFMNGMRGTPEAIAAVLAAQALYFAWAVYWAALHPACED